LAHAPTGGFIGVIGGFDTRIIVGEDEKAHSAFGDQRDL
jgi:hypothetical protein